MAVIGLLILASSILVHRAINEQIRGRRDRVSLSDFFPFLPDRTIEGISAAILLSHQTARYLAEVSTAGEERQAAVYEAYQEQATYWKNYLSAKNYDSTLIEDEELLTDLYRYNLLILPFSLCLSDEQISTIKLFLEQGKGVVFTHSSGNRLQNGEEREGWSLTSDVLGGYPFYPARQGSDQEVYYRITAETPLTINTNPGWETQVHTYDQPMAINLVETRAKEAAHWEILLRDEAGEINYLPNHTAIAYGNYTRGRFIWMGFNPSSIVDKPDVWSVFDRMLDDSIHWVTYRTVAGKAAWRKAQAAAAFSIIPQKDYIRGLSIDEIFSKHEIKPAFLIDYNQASFYRLILDQISKNSEIAAQLTDVFVPNELERSEVDRKMRTVKNELEKLLHVSVLGFESESSENLNYDAIGRAGYEYVWIRNEKGTIPKTIRTNNQSLFRRRRDTVVFQQSARSDLQLVEDYGDLQPEQLLTHLKRDFDSVYRVGGLYTVTFHSHLIGSELYQPVLDEFLGYVSKRDLFVDSPAALAEWWKKHDNVQIRIHETTRRVNLMVTNESQSSVESTTVFLYPAVLPESLNIRAERIHVSIPDYFFEPEETRIDLIIKNLNAGESRTYYIDYR
jgi:hypothetical protein